MPCSWRAARTSSLGKGDSARGGSEPRPAGPRPARDRASQPPPPSVLAEVTRHLPWLCPPAQLADVLVFQDPLAIDGILKSLERRLEVLDPRLERLQPLLPTDVSRPGACSHPSATPQPTHARCDRGQLRPRRPLAWRLVARALRGHC